MLHIVSVMLVVMEKIMPEILKKWPVCLLLTVIYFFKSSKKWPGLKFAFLQINRGPVLKICGE